MQVNNIDQLKKSCSNKTTKKAESFSIDKKYQIHFDEKFIEQNDIDLDDCDNIDEDLDYLSENECSMFNNDEDIYTLIRRANKIHLRFKQVNEILTSQVQHVVTYNLKVVNDIFKFSNKLFDKIYDSDSDSNQS